MGRDLGWVKDAELGRSWPCGNVLSGSWMRICGGLFEIKSLDWVFEEVGLEENLASAEVMEEGARTRSWAWVLVWADNWGELHTLGLFEVGLASLLGGHEW